MAVAFLFHVRLDQIVVNRMLYTFDGEYVLFGQVTILGAILTRSRRGLSSSRRVTARMSRPPTSGWGQ